MPKELHPNRQLCFYSSDLCHSLECRDLKRTFSSVVEWVSCGGGSFLLDRGFSCSPTCKQKRSLQTVLPENLAFPTLGNNLKASSFSQRIICLFLSPLPAPPVVPACSFIVVSWTSPKPSLWHLRLLGPPCPQLRQVTRPRSLDIFRDSHWRDLYSCFLNSFLSAFPVPRPRSIWIYQ